MTTINVHSPTMTTPRPPGADPRVWQRLGSHAAELHNEARGMRRIEYLSRSALGAFTLLRSLGVRIEVAKPQEPIRSRNAQTLKLTEREMQVLRGMSEGKSNAEIGRDLFICEDTVKTHARRMYRKIGARDRAHAVSLGFRMELLT